MCEAAWAASKSKGTYLQAQFRRLAALRGPKRALIAFASSILTAGYYMMQRATTYQELGPDYFDKPNTFEPPIAWSNALKHSGTELSSNPASPLLQAARRNFLGRPERTRAGWLVSAPNSQQRITTARDLNHRTARHMWENEV